MGRTAPKALLISLRDPHDPMATHEHMCFARGARLPEADVLVHSMVDGAAPARLLAEVDAVLFGGSGAYSVLDDIAWIRAGLDLLVDVIARQVPAYASGCGFQGLAIALGGRVEHDNDRAEMGGTELHLTAAGRADPLFGTLPARFWAQEGHHDHVIELPPGVTLLAAGDVVQAQAFKVDRAPFWASQFHPELTPLLTLDRFRHYRDHYLDPSEAEAMFAYLSSHTRETPEVGELLARVVRMRRDAD